MSQNITSVFISCDLWTETSAPVANASAITISSDATYLAVTEYGGGILTSNDGGVNWTRTDAPVGLWQAIASSADGTHLAAVEQTGPSSPPGNIYTSSDAGATWSLTSAPGANWSSIASSADGTHLVASSSHPDITNTVVPQITYVGAIYISLDGGVTWSKTSEQGPASQVAISAAGIRVAAAFPTIVGGVDVESFVQGESGGVDNSPDGGLTWVTDLCRPRANAAPAGLAASSLCRQTVAPWRSPAKRSHKEAMAALYYRLPCSDLSRFRTMVARPGLYPAHPPTMIGYRSLRLRTAGASLPLLHPPHPRGVKVMFTHRATAALPET